MHEDAIEIADQIIKRGIIDFGADVEKIYGEEVKDLPKDFHLVYNFHEKEYIGGVHGLMGILNLLMEHFKLNNQFMKEDKQNNLLKVIQASLNFCLQYQFPSGNFASSVKKNPIDDLVQFCHGAPGIIAPLLQAANIFTSDANKYLQSAILAGQCVWKYGILKKGFGLCHGISGNGYGFLNLYNVAKNKEYIYYAWQFISIKEDQELMKIINNFDLSDRYKKGESDYPYSLMLGLAGDISFIIDSLQPEFSKFPGYEI